jgi:hypothetical protein
LEVGGGGVEEQQVDLEVEEIGDLVIDFPSQRRLDLEQGVHRPVAGVLMDPVKPVDGHV